jgi:hypothetical protein
MADGGVKDGCVAAAPLPASVPVPISTGVVVPLSLWYRATPVGPVELRWPVPPVKLVILKAVVLLLVIVKKK